MQSEKSIMKISFIGSGNVAWQLAAAFRNQKIQVVEVFSANEKTRLSFAELFDCSIAENVEKINKTSDLYIIAIPDKEIEKVVAKFPQVDGIVAHTSGNISMQVLKKFNQYGVFYPLQTLTEKVIVNMSKVPFCIEASDKKVENELFNLASTISKEVYLINSEQRKNLHLSAVLVNNFTNLMYTQAHDLLENKGLDFKLLLPLIEETARKIVLLSPAEAQTGPARRNDQSVIDEHLEMLKDKPEIRELYSLLSEQIRKKYHE